MVTVTGFKILCLKTVEEIEPQSMVKYPVLNSNI